MINTVDINSLSTCTIAGYLMLALSSCSAIAKASDAALDPSIAKARMLCTTRHYQQAAKICETKQLAGPLNSYATSVLAWTFAGRGDLSRALELLLEARRNASSHSDKTICEQLLGEVYENLGMRTEATAAYAAALRANPHHGNSRFWHERIATLETFPKVRDIDYASRTPQTLKGWPPNQLIHVCIVKHEAQDVVLVEGVKQALRDWCATAGSLRYQFVRDPSTADMVVHFLQPGQLQNATTACRYHDVQSGSIVKARVFISESYRHSSRNYRPYRNACRRAPVVPRSLTDKY